MTGRRHGLRGAAVCLALALLSSVACAGGAAAATGRDLAPAPPGISVLGPRLIKDGSPWIPRGVQIVGLVAPDGSLAGKYVAANANYSAAELVKARDAGADTIRFQVSEFGLDPLGTLYSPAYVAQVQNAVQTARGLGLAVIVSMQAEAPAGETVRCPLPDGQTERAWAVLAPAFAGDHGVMFELYNEPGLATTATDWQTWLNGGPVVGPGELPCLAVGMQSLVDEIRADGATNVLVVPGLANETSLAGIPALTDPANPSAPQLAYGIHYPLSQGPSTVWDAAFGRFSARAPVIVTEWDENSTTACVPNSPTESALLLDYLAAKQIGIVGFAFDLPGTIITDYSSHAPTTFDSFACGVPGSGPGALLFGDFAASAQAGGPSQLGAIPAWVISSSALTQLETTDVATTTHFFDTSRTFVTGASDATVSRLAVPAAVPTQSFASATALVANIEDGTLRPGTRAVVLDDEHWAKTPLTQQLHPGMYYRLAAQVAHQYGLLLIADPATNLVLARAPRTLKSDQYAAFVRLRIAAAAARYADIYEIDARGSDTKGPGYQAFVQAASAQAAAAAPGVTLLATLSSGPPGTGHRSVKNLLGGALATRELVSGYQLNDLRPGGGCRSCKVSPAQMAGAFLRGLLNTGG